MFKKFQTLIIFTVLFSLLLAACASTTNQPADTGSADSAQEAAVVEEEAAADAAEEAPIVEEEAAAEEAAMSEEEEAAVESEKSSGGLVVVGSKDFSEQFILGQMTVLALQDAGFEVEDATNLGGTAVVREALVNGDIDIYWEYTGTAWLTHLGHEDAITDSQDAYDKVKAEDEANGLIWLDMSPFNNTYTLMMKQEVGEELGIKSISDLAAYINDGGDASLCTNQEFYARPDGFKGVEELYGFQFSEEQVVLMDSGLTYKALQDGQCTTAMGFATDGRISAFGFFNLEDDKFFFPVYNPAPIVREEVLEANPSIAEVLNPIAAALTTEKMTELNKVVDIDGKEPVEAACDFLTSEGFLEECP